VIDVVVPVYLGLAQTRRCIESVLRNRQDTAFELVVVDDASPDPEIVAYLDGLARQGRITLARNERNAGFVQTANRGMSLHPDRDVVLLNSDTEVANDWLDRLRRSAWSRPDIGTVTPFSNNATICSYPFEGWAGGVPGTLGLAGLDRLFAIVNAGRMEDLPTAVGFCMYIRRECLNATGLFDAERFGRGYGEENDFCLRAAKAGWRSVLAGDVFVFHEGAVSFSDERIALTTTAARTLSEIHPDYLRTVREFVARDPLNALRQAVDRARAARGPDEERCVAAERAHEWAHLNAKRAQVEKLAEERAALIGELRQGLAHAEALVSERDAAILARDAAILARDEEIAKLRSGLAHAETLAFAHARELDRIHAFWMWKYMNFLMRGRS